MSRRRHGARHTRPPDPPVRVFTSDEDQAARAEAKAIAHDVTALRRFTAARAPIGHVRLVSLWVAMAGVVWSNPAMGAIGIATSVATAIVWQRVSRGSIGAADRLLARDYEHPVEVEALLVSGAHLLQERAINDLLQQAIMGLTRHADSLTHRQVELLAALLYSDGRLGGRAARRFHIAALRVLALVGDTNTLAAIDELMWFCSDEQVLAAARQCSASIRERLAAGNDKLLRPTDAPGEALLRPTEPDADQDTLLRPANRDE